ncbi:MAG: cytochrome-c oxidase, cbb3-type subunit III [Xanthomonadales bacterium]|nr:cytochrome-c oxidase, cbb3-type subunit III [Xanthomonadales bacterium]
MSNAWSIYVITLTTIMIVGCVWLLWYTSRPTDGSADETTGHVWDGDLREYNKPLPRWWLNLFYITIIFSIGYLIWYPGLGNFAGIGGWTSAKQHDEARDEAEARLAPIFARFETMPIEQIARDDDGLALGRSVFANNCATCHGSDARGAIGFPNLTSSRWQWGGDPETILTTILDGRHGIMPPFAAAIGDELAMTETAVYVQSLSGRRVSAEMAAAGKRRYDMICLACHGADGTGNPALGAPDLTDDDWVYGSSLEAIRYGILHGRQGQMPAHRDIIGPIRARLVAAWVWSLSNPPADGDNVAP